MNEIDSLSQKTKRSWLSPPVVFLSVWLLVFILYSFRLSNQLIFTSIEVFKVLGSIAAFFLLGYILSFIFLKGSSLRNYQVIESDISKLKNWFYFWVVVTVCEIILSGGVPMLWYLTGISKTYFDFGIPGLHGLMNALLLTISLNAYISYLTTQKKEYLFFVFFIIFWGIFVIARQLVVVYLLEILFVYCLYQPKKIVLKSLLKIFFLTILSILIFGWVGDFRNGREVIIAISSLSFHYPDWLPSGFLWVYMYLVTPINNLINATIYFEPSDYSFFNTTISQLLPSFLRRAIYGVQVAFEREWLYARSFTVSSAFINPFNDVGFKGIVIFSLFIGAVSSFVWHYTKKSFLFLAAVILQCLALSVFVNHFFYLPVISQLFWYFVISHRFKFK
ncbi:O-antigen polymerase [Salinisphaera sp. G21_0]|uniref:O-antigen polymerase n=1 Tax=Salinisphaera sp. G21_0 TaxID=2821094 RepID=UPI001ADB835C|nr:O-antigen polymerase [Salinisphaera sp. G21_0]MBO9483085.1 oligosaccharide repeat unit polymerase [Salinisphaera sp. G21_0]